jgi:hypothetical protein
MNEAHVSAKRQCVYSAPEIKLMIHHQFPGIELISPIYASYHATCSLPLEQKVNAGSTMQVRFNVESDQDESISILMCRLGRMNEFNEDEATCIQLVIVWRIDRFKRLLVVTYLVEHDKSRVWDRNMLMKLARWYKLFDIQHVPIEDTWLMHDNTVLMTSLNVIHEKEYCKLEMTIAETSMKDNTQRLIYIGLNR